MLRDPRLRGGAVAAFALAAAVVSWSAVWVPERAARAQKQRDSAVLRQSLARVEAMLQDAGGQEAWLASHRARLTALQRRFVHSRELPGLLDAVLEQVTRANLRITNVTRGNFEPAIDANGAPLLLDGTPMHVLPVVVEAEGRFHGVLECLSQWTDPAFKGLLGIEGVEMRLLDPLTGRLGATLQVQVHVLDSP